MYRDYIELGSTPCSEKCAQVGELDYNARAHIECKAYVHQLERIFPIPDGVDAAFRVKMFPHDFGSYHEVVVYFGTQDEKAIEYAFHVENNLPEYWDPEAMTELKKFNDRL